MSVQKHFSKIVIHLVVLCAVLCLAARPNLLHPRELQKYPTQSQSSQDPDAVLHSDSSESVDHRPRRRLLSADTTLNGTKGRMAFGQQAALGQFPWVAYFDPGNSVCTASLITPRAVLSAAHCVISAKGVWKDMSKAAIYIGSNYWYDDNLLEYKINSVWIPAEYNPADDFYGDLAVVALATAVPNIKPITLASPSTRLSGADSLTIIGWGQLETGEMPDYLYYAPLTYNQAQCMARYEKLFGSSIEIDHICTGASSNPAIQSCGGDSGGPTILTKAGSPPVQVAVTSYGYGDDDNCGIAGENINVDTSVAYWRTWIENMLSYENLRGSAPPARMNTVAYSTCYSASTGAPLKTFKGVTAGYKCCEACRVLTTCKAWTHSSDLNTCVLLSGKGKIVKNKACTSGWYK